MPDQDKKTQDNDIIEYLKSLLDKVKKQFEDNSKKTNNFSNKLDFRINLNPYPLFIHECQKIKINSLTLN